MTERAASLRTMVPRPALAALAATASVVLFLLWQDAMDKAAPLGLSSLRWFESLTPLDRRLLTLLLLVPGAALWLWALREDRPPIESAPTPVVPGPALDRRRLRALAAGLALVGFVAVLAPLVRQGGAGFGIIGYGQHDRAGNGFQFLGTLLWLVGGSLYLLAVAEPVDVMGPVRRLLAGRPLALVVTSTLLAVGLVTLLAAYFRFHDLGGLPYEMTSDHTEKLLDIREVVAGARPVFLPLNGGREPLQFYWTAILVWLGLPLSFLTLKVGAALVSLATVPLVFLLGRSVAGRSLGLLAAVALAMAPWHLQITRIALRTTWSPLFAAVCLWLLVRALDKGRRNDWLLLGAATAAGMYGYSGFRPMALLVPLVVAGKLGADAWRRRALPARGAVLPRAMAEHLAAGVGAGVMVVAPLARYALDRPADFWGRTLSRVSGSEVALTRAPLVQLALNMKTALLMFNATSDAAWFHSPPGRPALETVGGALLVAGALTAGVRLVRGDWRAGMLLLAVPIMLLSSALALAFPVEVPHLSRASGALPAVVVLVALGVPVLGRLWRKALGTSGHFVYLGLLAILFLPMAANASERVFVEYRKAYDNASLPTEEGAAVARAFVALGGDLDHVYLVSWPFGWDYRALGLVLGDPSWHNVMEGTGPEMADAVAAARYHTGDPAAKLYIVGGPVAQANIDALRQFYPAAVVSPHKSHMPDKDFWSVYVPPAGTGAPGDQAAVPEGEATAEPAPTAGP